MQTDKATALIRMDLPPALGPVINKESGSFPPSSIVLEMIFFGLQMELLTLLKLLLPSSLVALQSHLVSLPGMQYLKTIAKIAILIFQIVLILM